MTWQHRGSAEGELLQAHAPLLTSSASRMSWSHRLRPPPAPAPAPAPLAPARQASQGVSPRRAEAAQPQTHPGSRGIIRCALGTMRIQLACAQRTQLARTQRIQLVLCVTAPFVRTTHTACTHSSHTTHTRLVLSTQMQCVHVVSRLVCSHAHSTLPSAATVTHCMTWPAHYCLQLQWLVKADSTSGRPPSHLQLVQQWSHTCAAHPSIYRHGQRRLLHEVCERELLLDARSRAASAGP